MEVSFSVLAVVAADWWSPSAETLQQDRVTRRVHHVSAWFLLSVCWVMLAALLHRTPIQAADVVASASWAAAALMQVRTLRLVEDARRKELVLVALAEARHPAGKARKQ